MQYKKKSEFFSCISAKPLNHLWTWQHNCTAWAWSVFQVVGDLNN